MRVGIREFKNRATQLVRLVEAGGEEVTITRHNRPVAVLTRPLRNVEPNEDAVLDRLSAAGLLRRGDGQPFSKSSAACPDPRPSTVRHCHRGKRARSLIYLDTSALVKRYVAETGAALVRRMFLGTEPLATSALSYVEYFSALNRKRRESALNRVAYQDLARAFEADWTGLQVVQLTESVLRSARRLLERHELRAGGAVQLASALAIAGSVAVRFASADGRLAEAATREGLAVLEENL